MMGAEGLEAFKASLRKQESGTYEGEYNQRGLWRDGDGEVGAYGVLASNFQKWAAEAGLAGADWRDSDVQERVISDKLAEYYEEFRDWSLVAYAWIGGTEYARKVQQDNYWSSALYEGEPVSKMAQSLVGSMKDLPSQYQSESRNLPYDPNTPEPQPIPPKPGTVSAKEQLVGLFNNWGTELAGGQRVDYRTLTDDLADDEDEDDGLPTGNQVVEEVSANG